MNGASQLPGRPFQAAFWPVLRTLAIFLIAVGCADAAGARDPLDRLASRFSAFTCDPVYTGEVFTNTRGGISTKNATQYQALLDLEFRLDFEESQLPIPGNFYLLAQNTHGRGLTEDFIGDTQVISNIDSSRNITQVSEYWWEFDLADGDVVLRIGKQDVNTEFLFVDTASDFIQSTFGLSPSTAFPTFPDPSFGAVALLKLTDSWTLKAGLWDAFASGSSWGFSGNDSVLMAVELERHYELGGKPGTFAIGAVYESSGVIDNQPVSDVHEYVFQIEQVVFRENPGCKGDRQALAAFGGYYPRFPGSQIIDESIGDSFIAGLTYTGILPCRDADVLGVGVAWTELFQGGTNEETVVETFYKAQLSPHVSLQPDVQYIATPSGIYRDSLAVGIRYQLTR